MEKKKKNWIKGAVSDEDKGKFAAKARAAGETTANYAKMHENDSGTLGKEARLALTLMKISKKGKDKGDERKRPSVKDFMRKMHGTKSD